MNRLMSDVLIFVENKKAEDDYKDNLYLNLREEQGLSENDGSCLNANDLLEELS